VLRRRSAALTALILTAGVATAAPAFGSATATILFVNNNTGANCSNSGTGTQAQPYCTIQAAADVVSAGQTIDVAMGVYDESVTITHSGTAAAPITIKGPSDGPAEVHGSAYALRIAGAANVVIDSMSLAGGTEAAAIVDNAQNVTLKNNRLNYGDGGYAHVQLHVTGGSTGVDIVDNFIDATTTSAIVLEGGGSGDTVSTNQIRYAQGAGISVDSVTGVDIVSNTVDATCDSGIALTGSATGATIENNIVARTHPTDPSLTCGTPATPPHGIEMGAGAVSGTIENYNDVDTGTASVPDYAWSGTDYATAAALNTATGQAATDSNAPTIGFGAPYPDFADVPADKSPAIDSADASAPGEQSTDAEGNARADDPLVTNTGNGSPVYADRGAIERRDLVTITQEPQVTGPSPNWPVDQAPAGAAITFTTVAKSAWGGTLTYTYNFGDGSPKVNSTSGAATHVYAAAGNFGWSVEITSSYTGRYGSSGSFTVVDTPPHPVVAVTPVGDMSISASVAGSTDPWGVLTAQVDFGDGDSAQVYDPVNSPVVNHTYSKAGTYTVTVTLNDAGQDNAQATATYTTKGSDFTAYGPTRVLDTRKGIGTGGVIGPVGAGQSVQVPIGGTGTIPADATAVALNVTETDAQAGGYITAYPTGGAVPTTSNLNYTQGQTKAANVIVGLGTGGKITLTNTSSGPVSLIADVTGYFTKTTTSGYQATAPNRVLDTRKGTGLTGGKPAKVGGGQTIPVTVSGGFGVSGVTAVVLNLTATNAAGGGYITAYGDGAARPVASSLNYAAGSTIANTVIVPVSTGGEIDLYNGSSAPVDLIADVEGYFSTFPDANGAFVPVTPTRLYDSRKSAPLGSFGTATLKPSVLDTQAQLPSTVAGYVYNLTVTQPAAGGYLTVYPAGTTQPTASNLNFNAGETTSNTAFAAAGSANGVGANSFYNGSGGTAQFVVDLFGYFANQ
jgi:hypothetical protein